MNKQFIHIVDVHQARGSCNKGIHILRERGERWGGREGRGGGGEREGDKEGERESVHSFARGCVCDKEHVLCTAVHSRLLPLVQAFLLYFIVSFFCLFSSARMSIKRTRTQLPFSCVV